jgi:hypothetical protein
MVRRIEKYNRFSTVVAQGNITEWTKVEPCLLNIKKGRGRSLLSPLIIGLSCYCDVLGQCHTHSICHGSTMNYIFGGTEAEHRKIAQLCQ